jgi:hypothetical protein
MMKGEAFAGLPAQSAHGYFSRKAIETPVIAII